MCDEETKQKFKAAMQASKKGNHEPIAALTRQFAFEGKRGWMFALALQYRDGVCVPESVEHAEFWIRMSAEQGYPDAILALAGRRSTCGPPEDLLKESRRILTRGVNRGHITQQVMDDNMDFLAKRNEQEVKKATKMFKEKLKDGHLFDFSTGGAV